MPTPVPSLLGPQRCIPVRYMCAKSSQLLGPLGETSIRDLGIGAVRKSKRDDAPQQPVGGSSPVDNHPPLVAVSPDMSTLLALDHMLTLGVSGAPVVTSGGEMVANLSISDLRCGMGVKMYGDQVWKSPEALNSQVLTRSWLSPSSIGLKRPICWRRILRLAAEGLLPMRSPLLPRACRCNHS